MPGEFRSPGSALTYSSRLLPPILPEFVMVLLEFPQFLPLRVTRLQHQFSQYKLLIVAFIKQFRCHKQQLLKTGTRLRRQTRMTTNLKIPIFKISPPFLPPLLIAARVGPPQPLLPRYATAYVHYLTATFPMTLTDPWPGFQGHGIFEVEYLKNLGTKVL